MSIPLRLLAPVARGVWRVGRAGRFAVETARDVGHWVRGLATRDEPARRHLFTAPTRARPVRMLLARPGHIEDRLADDGTWEPHVEGALSFLVPDDGVLVDVGANIGWHALRVACEKPGATVIAVEPNPSVHAELVANVAASAVDNVVVHDCALGDRDGTATLLAQTRRAYNRGSSSLRAIPDLGDRYARVEVPLRTLDGLVGDRHVDVIKIDVEGAELDVLAGAAQVIRRCRPAVLLEFEARYHRDALAALGRVRAALDGHALHVLAPDAPACTPLVDAAAASRLFRADLLALPG